MARVHNMIETWRPVLQTSRRAEPLFMEAYPDYASTGLLDELRASEYGYLDERDHVYLDYAAAGLPSDAQLRAHTERLRGGCFASPHGPSPSSMESTRLIERARDAVLRFFNADTGEYAVIFTPNATAACRLVGEAYPFTPGSRLILPLDNHNSVNGIREYAARARTPVDHVPLCAPLLRIDEKALARAFRRGGLTSTAGIRHHLTGRNDETEGTGNPGRSRGLFAYPAQSNFSGIRHPLGWIDSAHQHGYDVLLDAASYAPANRIDLSEIHPEYLTVSWYKVFGYPTGVGCLVARHEALEQLRRPWFAGGTVQAVGAGDDWALLAVDESAFEDGTPNFLAIPDVEAGLAWISNIGLDMIHTRIDCLTGWLLERLTSLHHADRRPAIQLYGPPTTTGRGGTVTFSILDPYGDPVDERSVARSAAAAGISMGTGCFDNPGAAEYALGARAGDVGRRGPDSVEEYLERIQSQVGGVMRVSLGLVSTLADVERLVAFVEKTYLDRFPDLDGLDPRTRL
jgi:selenocysteine lyase/cysteine desulfurase